MNDSAELLTSPSITGVFWRAEVDGQPQQLTWKEVSINYSRGRFSYY